MLHRWYMHLGMSQKSSWGSFFANESSKGRSQEHNEEILKGPAAALPNPELKAIAKARANTVKEMAARDEPVSDDHAEGEQEEPKEEETTVADDDRQGSGTE